MSRSRRSIARQAEARLAAGRIKGRSVKVRLLPDRQPLEQQQQGRYPAP